jgi:hypothetical protein
MQSLLIVIALDELRDVKAKILKVLILFGVNFFLF